MTQQSNWIERLIAEEKEESIKIDKLQSLLLSDEVKGVEIEKLELLVFQLKSMVEKLAILRLRLHQESEPAPSVEKITENEAVESKTLTLEDIKEWVKAVQGSEIGSLVSKKFEKLFALKLHLAEETEENAGHNVSFPLDNYTDTSILINRMRKKMQNEDDLEAMNYLPLLQEEISLLEKLAEVQYQRTLLMFDINFGG